MAIFLLNKLKQVLGKAKSNEIDAVTLSELEDSLISADIGVHNATKLIEKISKSKNKDLRKLIFDELVEILLPAEQPLKLRSRTKSPIVIMMTGVNGSGKTTTIGKLTHLATKQGLSVMIAACDTFRAAAPEQLEIWGKRAGAKEIVLPLKIGEDPASVAHRAAITSISTGVDILIIDTAGRLHNKQHLMDELAKIARVVARQMSDSEFHKLLVLDITTGQNAKQQVLSFSEAVGITGLIITKLDGSAQGGTIISIVDELKLPVHFVANGEAIDDLKLFNAKDFVNGMV